MAQLNVGTGSACSKGYLHKQISAPSGCRANADTDVRPVGPYLFSDGAHGRPLLQIGLCRHTSASPRYPKGWARGSLALASEAMLAAVSEL